MLPRLFHMFNCNRDFVKISFAVVLTCKSYPLSLLLLKILKIFYELIMAAEKMKVHASEPEEEEDLVDPMEAVREECSQKHCGNFLQKLTECNDRVNSRKKTAEVCAEELIDLLHCRDHCAVDKIFKHLK